MSENHGADDDLTSNPNKNMNEEEREEETVPISTNTAAACELPASQSQGAGSGFVPASPPRFISLDEMMEASRLISDMSMAHEIALDEEFELKPSKPAEGSIEKQVSDIMKKAFWDILSEKLSKHPPDYSSVLVLIADIKEKLIGLLSERQTRARSKIEEVLDMELIEQKVENDAFEVEYYTQFVRTVMSQLCAPVRDDEIAKLKDIKEIVPLFRETFRLLDVMHVDMANYTIAKMRPYIKEQSVTYEREKFDQFLTNQQGAGVDGLEYIREWLERSYEVLDEHTADQELFHTSLKDISTTPANVLNGAFIELINWNNNIYPETCLMDQQRFMDISHNLRKLTLISSALLVSFTQMGDKLRGHTQLRDRLKAEVLAILSDVPEAQYPLKMVNISAHISQEVNKELGILGYKQLESDQLKEYENAISAVIDRDHPVHALLWKRIMTFMWQSLSHSGSSRLLQLPPGLGAVSDIIATYCGKFLKLASYNRAVFGSIYADIIATLMNMTDISPRLPQTAQKL